MSGNIETNDLSVKNTINFDALMEIENADFHVSITLENFGLVSEQTEAELLQSILV